MQNDPTDWRPLINHLKQQSPFLYLHNPGNAGDALIFLGFDNLMKANNIEYYPYSRERFNSGIRKLVYSGGGNLVPSYSDCSSAIRNHFEELESFTLMPHTIAGHEELLSQLDSRFHLFSRDPNSYQHCQETCPASVSLHLSHDVAFACLPSRQPPSKIRFYPTTSLGRILRWSKRTRSIQKYIRSGGCHFFREDCERTDSPLPDRNCDISNQLTLPQRSVRHRLAIAQTFLALLNQARSIQTNRLHVAIAGALLGKPTHLHPNAYFKNQAIYNHSLAPHFPHVRFQEPGVESDPQSSGFMEK